MSEKNVAPKFAAAGLAVMSEAYDGIDLYPMLLLETFENLYEALSKKFKLSAGVMKKGWTGVTCPECKNAIALAPSEGKESWKGRCSACSTPIYKSAGKLLVPTEHPAGCLTLPLAEPVDEVVIDAKMAKYAAEFLVGTGHWEADPLLADLSVRAIIAGLDAVGVTARPEVVVANAKASEKVAKPKPVEPPKAEVAEPPVTPELPIQKPKAEKVKADKPKKVKKVKKVA